MTRQIALASLIGVLAGPPAVAGGAGETLNPMAEEAAVSHAQLERVRGLNNPQEPDVQNDDVRATGPAGTNRIADSFTDFGGVGHVIQNNGNNAAIGVTTEINVGPEVSVGPQG